MKKHILEIALTLLLIIIFINCRQHNKQKWEGDYKYTNNAGVKYRLIVEEDVMKKNFNELRYSGNGPNTKFLVSCIGKVEGDEFVIYYRQILQDADEGFVKPKNTRIPIIKLYFNKGELYTEGYNSSDKEVDKGPKLLFKKINYEN